MTVVNITMRQACHAMVRLLVLVLIKLVPV
jgi:hypothetical protein